MKSPLKERKLCFFLNRHNSYSFSSLLGALEGKLDKSELMEKVDIIWGEERWKEEFSNYSRSLFLFSFTYLYWKKNKSFLEKIVAEVKKNRNITLVGGVGVEGIETELLGIGVDYVFKGEGEDLFPELISSFLENDFSYAQIIEGKPVSDLSSHFPLSSYFNLFRPIEITRGCFWRCWYCQTPFFFKGRVIHRSIDSILKGLEILYKSGKKRFSFTTPDAFSYGMTENGIYKLEKVENLLKNIKGNFKDAIIEWGIFPSELNPYSITKESIQLLKRYAHNRTVVIGAQSGSREVLEKINRPTYPELVYEKVALLRKEGFKVYVDYIFGFPFETEEDRQKTLTEIRRLEKLGARIHTHYFIPLPQTPLGKYKPRLYSEYLEYLEKSEKNGKSFGNWREQIDTF